MTYRKKLIEVAMPLDIIDENSKTKGFHTGMHLWWARRPLATAKAIILSSLIDDPSNELDEIDANKERKKIFKLIEKVMKTDSYSKEILKYISEDELNSITLLDPFSGGGTIPLAAKIIGLKSKGVDLNPVAVLIGKSLVEIPSKICGVNPISPTSNQKFVNLVGSKALSYDVNYYGNRIYDELKNELNLYNQNDTSNLYGILWARSITCSNPACKKKTPLVNNLKIAKNKNLFLDPQLNDKNDLFFKISDKHPYDNESIKIGRSIFRCIHCNTTINSDYIKYVGKRDKLEPIPAAKVINAGKKREYFQFDSGDFDFDKKQDFPIEIPFGLSLNLNYDPRAIWCPPYGLESYEDLFLPRQLYFLLKLSDKINQLYDELISECDKRNVVQEYAKSIIIYLSLAFDKFLEYYNTLVRWRPDSENSESLFSRAGIPMIWDFIEINPFFDGNSQVFKNQVKKISKIIEKLPEKPESEILNFDSAVALNKYKSENLIISTDPPYYDNIGYADVSDFFYVWLRINLKKVCPDLFVTVLTPKKEEIVAIPYRFGGDKQKAINHFKKGLEDVFKSLAEICNEKYPITIYYAFRQEEKGKSREGILQSFSSAWETMLEGLINANLQITGTWPIRTETRGRATSINTNALASSIIIVCRPLLESATLSTRKEFIKELKKELPQSLKNLQDVGIAPVDMAQSAIGPGIAVYSRYSKVLEADGNPMSVRTALQIINQELDAFLTEQESDMDQETRFCVAWYEQFGWKEGAFGDANTLATAKGTAVNGLETANVVYAKAGKVRLLKRSELDDNWDPASDKRLTVWECVQHLIKRLDCKGEVGAAQLITKIGGLSEPAKELTYRLYSLSEKNGWTEDGIAYNSLISSWQSIADKAQFAEQVSKETKKRLKDKSQKTLLDL